MSEKIKYWWSEDRQWFCVLVNDGTSQATVSLTVKEAEALMGEVQQTPSFLKLQDEAWEKAKQLMDERGPRFARRDKQCDEPGKMDRLSIEKLAKHFRVSSEQARKAQDEIGFMYRQRA